VVMVPELEVEAPGTVHGGFQGCAGGLSRHA
jgi:hypothetical protein